MSSFIHPSQWRRTGARSIDEMSDEEVADFVRRDPTAFDAVQAAIYRRQASAPVLIEPAARRVKVDGVELRLTRPIFRVLASLQLGWADLSDVHPSRETITTDIRRGVEAIGQASPRLARSLQAQWQGRRVRVVCTSEEVRFAGPLIRPWDGLAVEATGQDPVAAQVEGTTLLASPTRPDFPLLPPGSLEIIVAAIRRAA